MLSGLLMFVALGVASGACYWAWQLQQEMHLADQQLRDYASRISDLEARLSDTDEGMSQNAAVQAAKLKELDSEVRKLWDNVWKQAKARLAALEASGKTQGEAIDAMQASLDETEATMQSASEDIVKLNSVAGDLSRLMASARSNQEEVERVADTLNRIDLDLAKLSKRVQGNEEWVGSINAFRRQINASLSELQAQVRAQQVSPQ